MLHHGLFHIRLGEVLSPSLIQRQHLYISLFVNILELIARPDFEVSLGQNRTFAFFGFARVAFCLGWKVTAAAGHHLRGLCHDRVVSVQFRYWPLDRIVSGMRLCSSLICNLVSPSTFKSPAYTVLNPHRNQSLASD